METPSATLDTIYTEDEAAARLRITRRAVITLGKRYGCCSLYGRNVRFSEQDLLDLWQMLRATPKEPRHATVKAELPGASGVWLREYFRKKQADRDEQKRLRKEREAAARERRLEEKRQASRAKAEARSAKRAALAAAKLEAKTATHAGRPTNPKTAAYVETLDTKNRDPAYWTEERKQQLRQERIERMKRRATDVTGDKAAR